MPLRFKVIFISGHALAKERMGALRFQFAYNHAMQISVSRIFGSLYGRQMNTLAVICAGLLLLMLVIFLLDANVVIFHFFNQLNQYTGDGFWANTTSLGEGLVVLSLAGLVAIRWPAAAWAIIIGGIVGTLIVHGLKELVAAPRPALVLPDGALNIIGRRLHVVSFPSGHTATIAAFATILFLHTKNNWLRVFLVTLVIMVGISRMAVGAHWPVDVLAGWLVGIVIAVISFVLAERWTFGLKVPTQSVVILLSILCAGALFWMTPYMPEVSVLRWVIASIGMVSGIWALIITHKRNGLGLK